MSAGPDILTDFITTGVTKGTVQMSTKFRKSMANISIATAQTFATGSDSNADNDGLTDEAVVEYLLRNGMKSAAGELRKKMQKKHQRSSGNRRSGKDTNYRGRESTSSSIRGNNDTLRITTSSANSVNFRRSSSSPLPMPPNSTGALSSFLSSSSLKRIPRKYGSSASIDSNDNTSSYESNASTTNHGNDGDTNLKIRINEDMKGSVKQQQQQQQQIDDEVIVHGKNGVTDRDDAKTMNLKSSTAMTSLLSHSLSLVASKTDGYEDEKMQTNDIRKNNDTSRLASPTTTMPPLPTHSNLLTHPCVEGQQKEATYIVVEKDAISDIMIKCDSIVNGVALSKSISNESCAKYEDVENEVSTEQPIRLEETKYNIQSSTFPPLSYLAESKQENANVNHGHSLSTDNTNDLNVLKDGDVGVMAIPSRRSYVIEEAECEDDNENGESYDDIRMCSKMEKDHDNCSAGTEIKDIEIMEEVGKKEEFRIIKILKDVIFPLSFLIAASIGSYNFTEATGTYALGKMSEEMQKSALEQIRERLIGYMDQSRIYLQTGIAMSDELGLDLGQFQDLKQLLPYQHHFLDNYFDDSRCCSGIFTNIKYDHNLDGIDDVLTCHALEAPDCSAASTGSMETEIAAANLTGPAIWAGVLHYSDSYTSRFRSEKGDVGGNIHHGDFVQVLPGNINGAPNNTLTFKYYEHQNAMGDWFGDNYVKQIGRNDNSSTACVASEERCFVDATDNHWVQPIGFVHWPIQDGYWYREIQIHDMQKGDIRSSPRVFPWTLYPPAVLKVHFFTPVFNKEGTERIGGWVVGFKLHWISRFLSNLKMDGECMGKGCFCFIVERNTGHLIATSDPSIPVLSNDDTTNGEPIQPIVARNSTDIRVSSISKQVIEENGGDWDNVHGYLSRKEISVDSSAIEVTVERLAVRKPFILTSDFIRRSNEPMNSSKKDVPYGIDWVIVLSIPEEMVIRSITEKKTHNSIVLVVFSIGLGFAKIIWQLIVALVFVCYTPYMLKRQLKNNHDKAEHTQL